MYRAGFCKVFCFGLVFPAEYFMYKPVLSVVFREDASKFLQITLIVSLIENPQQKRTGSP